MVLRGTIRVVDEDVTRTIELYEGDLSALPPEHAVDILVVSAFPDDYLQTRTSLIGALGRRGLSVAGLAAAKALDLRSERSCWLSHEVDGQPGFRRVLCFEPLRNGSPPEVVDDIFDSLDHILLGDFREASVAMPIVSAGDMGFPVTTMLAALLDAAVERLRIGLPLKTLKIVEVSHDKAIALERSFTEYTARHGATIEALPRRRPLPPGEPPVSIEDFDGMDGNDHPGDSRAPAGWDCFISYSRRDAALVDSFIGLLRRELPGIRVFRDSESLRKGSGWIGKLADAIDTSRRFVAFFSPDYFGSTWCRREFEAAIIRSDQGPDDLLYPLYIRSDPKAPSLYLTFNYADCIEADLAKLEVATRQLASELAAGAYRA